MGENNPWALRPQPGDTDDYGNVFGDEGPDFSVLHEETPAPAADDILTLRDGVPAPDEMEVSEDAIALAFTARHRNNMRFCKQHGAWYEWDGSRWKRDEIDRAFHFAREISRKLGGGKAKSSKSSVAAGVERFARADPAHAIKAEMWDSDPLRMGTEAGTLDLLTGQILRPDPSAYITRLAGSSPSAAKPVMWLDFLNQATRGDQQLIDFLQRMCGYLLTGLVSEHALFFVHGPGGNGKSVFLNTLTHILGDYATTAPIDTFTAGLGNRHPTELAMLQGARGVFANETEAGSQWAEARIKSLTGGDAVSARFMRQDFFTFKPQFKLIIVGNHAPSIANVDEALRRRFNIIPFLNKPLRPDPMLKERLKEEAPAIFAWMIDGCMDWQQNGLGRPQAIIEATDAYFAEQDLFGQWLEEKCDVGGNRMDTTGSLFASYSAFMRAMGDSPGSVRAFSFELQKRGFRRKKSDGQRVFERLCVKPMYEQEQ